MGENNNSLFVRKLFKNTVQVALRLYLNAMEGITYIPEYFMRGCRAVKKDLFSKPKEQEVRHD